MPKAEFTLTTVSPMFLNGADPRSPELRAASVRGQLRYWLRAILGAQYGDKLNKIWEEESKVFGSTGQGSVVSVRLFGDVGRLDNKMMLPHREGSSNPVSRAAAIKMGEGFRLELVTRPGVALPDNALNALKLWSLLGGMGKRSRRMFGAVQIDAKASNPPTSWYQPLTTPSDLQREIKATLENYTIFSSDDIPKFPKFPTLQPKYSWIIVAGEGADNPEEANQEFFRKLLRNSKYKPKSKAFGYVDKGERRASPVIAQVRKLGEHYYPVITAFRSEPMKDDDTKTLKNFMEDVMNHYKGLHVWGGW